MSHPVHGSPPANGRGKDSSLLNGTFRLHGPALIRRATKLTGRYADAWDLVQETLLRALDRPPEHVPADKLCNWLFVVMANLHVDRRRTAARRRFVALDEANTPSLPLDDEPHQPLWRELEYEQVTCCLPSLDPRFRQAYVLHDEEGLSLADTARRLSVPVSTAGTRVFRARRFLRAILLRKLAPSPTLKLAPFASSGGLSRQRRSPPDGSLPLPAYWSERFAMASESPRS